MELRFKQITKRILITTQTQPNNIKLSVNACLRSLRYLRGACDVAGKRVYETHIFMNHRQIKQIGVSLLPRSARNELWVTEELSVNMAEVQY